MFELTYIHKIDLSINQSINYFILYLSFIDSVRGCFAQLPICLLTRLNIRVSQSGIGCFLRYELTSVNSRNSANSPSFVISSNFRITFLALKIILCAWNSFSVLVSEFDPGSMRIRCSSRQFTLSRIDFKCEFPLLPSLAATTGYSCASPFPIRPMLAAPPYGIYLKRFRSKENT